MTLHHTISCHTMSFWYAIPSGNATTKPSVRHHHSLAPMRMRFVTLYISVRTEIDIGMKIQKMSFYKFIMMIVVIERHCTAFQQSDRTGPGSHGERKPNIHTHTTRINGLASCKGVQHFRMILFSSSNVMKCHRQWLGQVTVCILKCVWRDYTHTHTMWLGAGGLGRQSSNSNSIYSN